MKAFKRRAPTLAIASLFFAGLAACAGAPIVGMADTAPTYDRNELAAVSSGGNELRVVVQGDPFGAGEAATADATVAAMQGNVIGIPVRFALDPKQESSPPTRVVVYFNPRNMRGSESICAPNGAVAGGRSTDGKLSVTAAWCQSNFKKSSVSGRVSEATSLNSEAFRKLIAQTTLSLFPLKDINDRSNRDGCAPPC